MYTGIYDDSKYLSLVCYIEKLFFEYFLYAVCRS